MGLLTIVVYLIVAGVLFWAAQQLIGIFPMDEKIKKVINVLLVVFICLFILNLFVPIVGSFPHLRID